MWKTILFITVVTLSPACNKKTSDKPAPKPKTTKQATPTALLNSVSVVIKWPIENKTKTITDKAQIAKIVSLMTMGKGENCACKAQFTLTFTLLTGETREVWAMQHGWRYKTQKTTKYNGRLVEHLKTLFK